MVHITNHAEDRLVERCGINKKSLERAAKNALEYGLKHSEVSGSLKRFLDSLWLAERKANNMHIYQQKVYMFRDKMLITVINVPSKFHKTINKIQRSKDESRQGI